MGREGLSLGVVAGPGGGHYFEMMVSLQRVIQATVESRFIGSTGTLTREIEEHQEQVGLRHFVPQSSGMRIDKGCSSMRRFAEKVTPHFTESSSSAIVGADQAAKLARAPAGL